MTYQNVLDAYCLLVSQFFPYETGNLNTPLSISVMLGEVLTIINTE